MLQIGISDISKNPSIIDKVDEIAQIVNKKTKKVKGVFIPSEYLSLFDSLIKEVEYKKFVKRNETLIDHEYEDETIIDGLNDAY
ncbi:MAG: hypothetical protein U9Q62_05185 [Campylobacterota bacterium]|nr:hypothetical protein [Campylobacterota bacterium]